MIARLEERELLDNGINIAANFDIVAREKRPELLSYKRFLCAVSIINVELASPRKYLTLSEPTLTLLIVPNCELVVPRKDRLFHKEFHSLIYFSFSVILATDISMLGQILIGNYYQYIR
jgi:hypothetical protein